MEPARLLDGEWSVNITLVEAKRLHKQQQDNEHAMEEAALGLAELFKENVNQKLKVEMNQLDETEEINMGLQALEVTNTAGLMKEQSEDSTLARSECVLNKAEELLIQ